MPRRFEKSKKNYRKLLDAYREHPGNHRKVADMCNTTRFQAKRAFEEGWPNVFGKWARPISEVLEEEAQDARALVVANKKKRAITKANAQQDALEVKAQEIQALKLNRGNLIALQATMARMTNAVSLVGKNLQEKLVQDVEEGAITPFEQVKVIKDTVSTMASLTQATQRMLEMERLVAGEPQKIIGAVDLTPDQAKEEIEKGLEALEELKRSGLFSEEDIVDGEIVE